MLIRRLRWAWRLKMWPWKIPANVVRFCSLRGITEADIRRGHELAEKYGWEKSTPM